MYRISGWMIVIAVLLSAFAAYAADDWCADVYSPNNPYNCCDNGNGMEGNCVWWAWHCRQDLPPWSGNAEGWLNHAVNDGIDTGIVPLIGSIACFPNMAYGLGHVAYVTEAYLDGSFDVSEMNCWQGFDGVDLKHYTTGSAAGFIYGGPVGSEIPCDIDLATAQPYIDAERSNQGQSNYGTMQVSTYWYYAFDPNNPYNSDGTSKSCYVELWSGGPFSNCGVVFDALGCATRAHTIRTGFWQDGNNQGWEDQGGPTSPLGMPVTNEYAQGSNEARQDFQLGYLHYQQGRQPYEVTVNEYPTCAPGWTADGWNPRVSYRLAQVYEDGGSRNFFGEAIGYAYLEDDTWFQFFQCGHITVSDNPGEASGQGDPPTTLEIVSGPYQMVMKDHLTLSEVNGNTAWFTTHYPVYGGNYGSTDSRVKIYCNGVQVTGYKESNRLYVTNYNSNGVYEADYPQTKATLTKGGLYNGYRTLYAPSEVFGNTWGNTHASLIVRKYSTWVPAYKETGTNVIVIPESQYDPYATYTAQYSNIDPDYPSYVSSGPGQMVYREKLTVAFTAGNTAWFNTYYSVNGGNYGNTDSRVQLYCNGTEVIGYKENAYLYVTNYNSNGVYEADYPRPAVELTKGGTYNGYRTLYAPSEVWGSTWGNTHNSLVVRKYSVGVTAYKETGTNVIVIPESQYDPNATYTAEYVEVWSTYAGKVVFGKGKNDDTNGNQPVSFTLFQNYPNPFNPKTEISYTLPQAGHVLLEVYNLLGQKVTTLVNEQQESGEHETVWNAVNQASGVYFCRIKTEEATETRKMVLLK
jgi:surface antigen